MKVKNITNVIYITLVMIIIISEVQGQDIDEIVENIYQQVLIHETQLDTLRNYSFIQKIHFIKMDGDGELEEQSKREFLVRVRSQEIRHRVLIAAYDFKNDQWEDVTETEKNQKQTENKGVKFSLTEMVSPEMRKHYEFSMVGDENIDSIKTIHLSVNPFEEDEEKFSGDLWFEKQSFSLVQAKLVPSEYPTAVEDMIMTFSMRRIGEIWLPVSVIFKAEVSFLIIFKGNILSEIHFEDYLFDQSFSESLFGR
jgi:hypothetical protein